MLTTCARILADHRLAQHVAAEAEAEREELAAEVRESIRLWRERRAQNAAEACDAEADSRLARAREEKEIG